MRQGRDGHHYDRAACTLDPKNANYRQNYECLFPQVPSREQGAEVGTQSANTGVSPGPVRENPKGGLGMSGPKHRAVSLEVF